jgi:hypothetical protein
MTVRGLGFRLGVVDGNLLLLSMGFHDFCH